MYWSIDELFVLPSVWLLATSPRSFFRFFWTSLLMLLVPFTNQRFQAWRRWKSHASIVKSEKDFTVKCFQLSTLSNTEFEWCLSNDLRIETGRSSHVEQVESSLINLIYKITALDKIMWKLSNLSLGRWQVICTEQTFGQMMLSITCSDVFLTLPFKFSIACDH